MPCSFRKYCLLTISVLLTGISWSATLPHPPPDNTQKLRRLTRQSGYIFAGTVINVESSASANNVPATRITFHIEQAIRGVNKGETLVIHEWAGIGESGEVYRRGERVFLFLYRPSRLGFTSPVGGPQGRFKLDSNGMVVLRQERLIALPTDSIFPPQAPGNNHVNIGDLARAIHQAEEE